MAISSIHIEAGDYNFFLHNDRTRPTRHSIFDDEPNEYWNDAKTAYSIWKSEVQQRSEEYTKRTGRRLHKKTITHLSAIVNLNQHHTMDDLKKVADYIEDNLGAKVVQLAIHRDEGHEDDDGIARKNYHAHIEMVGIDEQGQSVRRKLRKASLSKLQTATAQILGMERGTNYAKEKKPRPPRRGTNEYKRIKEAEERGRREELAKIKDVNEENKRLRAQLQEMGATREDYAKLEEEVRQLRQLAREKDLTIDEMRERIKGWRNYLNRDPETEEISDKAKNFMLWIAKNEQRALIEEPPERFSDKLEMIYWVDHHLKRPLELGTIWSIYDLYVSENGGNDSIKGIDPQFLAEEGEFSRRYARPPTLTLLDEKKAENEALRKENEDLSAQIEKLLGKIGDLESKLENLIPSPPVAPSQRERRVMPKP